MIKILFVRSEKAFLPEISAYINYFNKTPVFHAYDSANLPVGYNIDSYDIIWEFKGFGGISCKDKLLVHEYASLSTGFMPKVKNALKAQINRKPSLRVFLNNYVKSGYSFHDNIDFCLRDMGIDESFLSFRNEKKEYEFIYVGPVSKSRGMDKFLKLFSEQEKHKLCLVGNIENDIYNEYKNNKDIIFTGRVPYEDVPAIAAKAIYGINYIPDKYPYCFQTSTKLLEYVALGLKVITTNYQLVNEFERENGCSFYKLDGNSNFLDFDKIEKFKYVSNFYPEKYLWDNIIAQSGVEGKLLKIYSGK